MKHNFLWIAALFVCSGMTAQNQPQPYKKRVLESTEVDLLSSLYSQTGDHAAVSGGIGNESLQDATATIVIAIPLNDDDVLTIDAGVSAYTSASSSNINPFDGRQAADPYVASSGESQSDTWSNGILRYSHSSDNRNQIWSANTSFANEFDYSSIGVGSSFAQLLNEKNTEISLHGSAYFDQWRLIYPIELRPPGGGGGEGTPFHLENYTITGNPVYSPKFTPLSQSGRQSYAAGLGFSQILSKKMQGSLALDVVLQKGQLSTPFQRVYFSDVDNSYIENFHLADDIERLPDTRLKLAIGGRLNTYINEIFTVRTFYRYYVDDWGIRSHTASIEVPIKILMGRITLYPSYRIYNQTAADYFKPYDQHLSTRTYYTSDYDLSGYAANQYGFGVSYTDIFNNMHLWRFELKSIDLKYYHYSRNTNFSSNLITLGVKFILE
ncbi:MAG: DUF3570 domain-containing protein [Saprospiraceae bacterium]|nr:DUF3570 domain-containing protein [Saprospiraceae bacterium]